ncbi:hypothetical protein [Mycobacterium sp.]|uniref:hypothetical protein n=1 Tax=Mycobacterium sp. TaxID=1785 RepID=UPI002D715F17|nr:hypothetical protein [Mycobacterium sp.]HZA12775.1 hypothetical protein [Mycobacterium sp.]
MKVKREAAAPARRGSARQARPEGSDRARRRRREDAPPRRRGQPRVDGPPREKRPARSAPQTTPMARPTRPKSTSQAKARAKARKAKAPKIVHPPLRERLIARLSQIDLNPRTLAAKVPFVVLVIGSLGVGLGLTLWLSTDSAERSYELGNARETNRVLTQQKEALERDVLEAQAAPALAEAARNLGMIPSRDTAHLVQDPAGNWVVVGKPKPAEGAPPPPLNTPLPEQKPVRPPVPVDPRELSVRVTPTPTPTATPGAAAPLAAEAPAPAAGPELFVRTPGPIPAEAAQGQPVAPADAPPPANPAPAQVDGEQLPNVSPQITGPPA